MLSHSPSADYDPRVTSQLKSAQIQATMISLDLTCLIYRYLNMGCVLEAVTL